MNWNEFINLFENRLRNRLNQSNRHQNMKVREFEREHLREIFEYIEREDDIYSYFEINLNEENGYEGYVSFSEANGKGFEGVFVDIFERVIEVIKAENSLEKRVERKQEQEQAEIDMETKLKEEVVGNEFYIYERIEGIHYLFLSRSNVRVRVRIRRDVADAVENEVRIEENNRRR